MPSRIDLPGDVLNLEGLILHPFANGVFAKLDVPSGLQGHIVGSLDTCIIVIVKDSR